MATIEELKWESDDMSTIESVRITDVKSALPDDDEDDEEDESITERLIGLTEMFPKEVRNWGYSVTNCFNCCCKGIFSYSCSAAWLFFSSSAILFAPIVFEVERAQMMEAQRNQQKQVLLGPNPAMTGMGPSGMPMPPPVPR